MGVHRVPTDTKVGWTRPPVMSMLLAKLSHFSGQRFEEATGQVPSSIEPVQMEFSFCKGFKTRRANFDPIK